MFLIERGQLLARVGQSPLQLAVLTSVSSQSAQGLNESS